jgi:EXS family.
MLASIVSSFYAYTWDIKMDWGLFDKSAGENKFLREETVYSSTVSTTDRHVRPKLFSHKMKHVFAYCFIF